MNILKRIFLATFILLATLVSCQEIVQESINDNVYTKHVGGVLTDSIELKNGIKHGLAVKYNLDGELKRIETYKNDTLQGKQVVVAEGGAYWSYMYDSGLKSGSSHHYNKDNDLIAYKYFIEDSLIFSCEYQRNRISNVTGSTYIKCFHGRNFSMNDTLFINLYTVPVPKTQLDLCPIDCGTANEIRTVDCISYEKRVFPYVHSKILKEPGNHCQAFIVNVEDSLSSKSINRFTFDVEFEVN
jgi:antitoxin component YwqK of YwqJK toxin-antitoxin module